MLLHLQLEVENHEGVSGGNYVKSNICAMCTRRMLVNIFNSKFKIVPRPRVPDANEYSEVQNAESIVKEMSPSSSDLQDVETALHSQLQNQSLDGTAESRSHRRSRGLSPSLSSVTGAAAAAVGLGSMLDRFVTSPGGWRGQGRLRSARCRTRT